MPGHSCLSGNSSLSPPIAPEMILSHSSTDAQGDWILTWADLQSHIKEQVLVIHAQTTPVAPRVILGEMANVHHKHVALWEVGEVGFALIILGDIAFRGNEGCTAAPGSLLAPVLPGMPINRGGWVVALDGC